MPPCPPKIKTIKCLNLDKFRIPQAEVDVLFISDASTKWRDCVPLPSASAAVSPIHGSTFSSSSSASLVLSFSRLLVKNLDYLALLPKSPGHWDTSHKPGQIPENRDVWSPYSKGGKIIDTVLINFLTFIFCKLVDFKRFYSSVTTNCTHFLYVWSLVQCTAKPSLQLSKVSVQSLDPPPLPPPSIFLCSFLHQCHIA